MGRRSELRERRRAHGYTQEDLAHELDVSVSAVRSWEQGDRAPHIGTRPTIADLLGISTAEVNRWFSDGAETAEGIMPEWLGTFAALEQAASEIWAYEPIVVPGLVQTAAYATAVQRGAPVPPDSAEVKRAVQARLARQAVLTREPDPLRLHLIIDESVLCRPVGGSKVMAGQLAHLIELSARPNVTIQILPFDSGVYLAAFGYFAVLSSPRVERPYMAHVLDRAGSHYLDRHEDVDKHARLFQHLLTAALSPTDTVALFEATLGARYS